MRTNLLCGSLAEVATSKVERDEADHHHHNDECKTDLPLGKQKVNHVVSFLS
jgi:hypothetical protein